MIYLYFLTFLHTFTQHLHNIYTPMDPEVFDTVFILKRNVFLSSPGGCGKSYTLKQLYEAAVTRGVKSAIMSTTGVSAINIGGSTLHRWAGIKTGDKDKRILLQNILSDKKLVERWRKVEILFIDEISMLGGELFDKIDYIAKNLRIFDQPMGGIQLVVSGDLLQLPPINDVMCFESEVWEQLNFKTVKSFTPYRYPDLPYFHLLLRARVGELTVADKEMLVERVKAYKNLDYDSLEIKPTVLYSRKKDVDSMNTEELGKIPLNCKEYRADDTITQYEDITHPVKRQTYTDLLNEQISMIVRLKVGAQVMLTINLDPELGLANGSRGVVVECDEKHVMVKFKNVEQNVRVEYALREFDDHMCVYTRSQIPLILAYSLTVHRAQGASLDSCVIDLGHSIFEDGQAYVALSRCRSLSGLYLINFIPRKVKANEVAKRFDATLYESM